MYEEISRLTLQAYELILAQAPGEKLSSEFDAIITSLQERLDRSGLYSSTSVIFGYFVSFVSSRAMHIDHNAIAYVSKQLLGDYAYLSTIVIHTNLFEFLSVESKEIYNSLFEFIDIADSDPVDPVDYRSKHQHILSLSQTTMPKLKGDDIVAEFLLRSLLHITCLLPRDGTKSFSLTNRSKSRYSSIRPKDDTLIEINEQVQYIKTMLQKIRGDQPMFLDIQNLFGDFHINFR